VGKSGGPEFGVEWFLPLGSASGKSNPPPRRASAAATLRNMRTLRQLEHHAFCLPSSALASIEVV
jgi:hypothetical protein